MSRWQTVIFMDGDEGGEVVDRLTNVEGVVSHGADEESIQAAADHLAQWDYGDADDDRDGPSWGPFDQTAEVTAQGTRYTLAWNLGLGYVSLNREIPDEEQ